MNALTDQELLRDYAEKHSEPAFGELVRRHIDLVYSAARRMVCDPHQAEDVTQGVFVALAQNARKLTGHPVLSGWLHRTTQNLAANNVRANVRRQAREQEAAAMNELPAQPDVSLRGGTGEENWDDIAPHLDAALGELSEPDRDAVLLRYFERKSGREMAETLGLTEDAAQKRVSRAVERLREFFARRGITASAGGLTLAISANAVQSAPASLAITVSSAAAIAGTVAASAATATTVQTIAMTTLQKALITATVAVLAGAGLYEARQAAAARRESLAVKQQQATLTEQIQQLRRERDEATNQLAFLAGENAALKRTATNQEILKLRGEVGRLRRENEDVTSGSALNKITANPETRELMRNQQKVGMTALYSEFAKKMKWDTDQGEQLGNLLADDVMENIDLITVALRDAQTPEEVNRLFNVQEAALLEKVRTQFGPDVAAQYKEYTGDLCSKLSAQQMTGILTGADADKAEKTKQLHQIMQEETRAALAAAGLPPDYQTVPILNFRNIASEETAERNLKLLGDIYDQLAVRASAFLSAEELEKLKTYKKTALENSRTTLMINRKIMAPLSQ